MIKEILFFLFLIVITNPSFSQESVENKKKVEEIIHLFKENAKKQIPIDKTILDEAFALEKQLYKNPELIQYKGIYFYNNSNYVLAKKYFLLAAQYFNLPKDNNLLAIHKEYLGSLCAIVDEYQNAKKYYNESINIYKKINNSNRVRILQRLLIYLEYKQGNKVESLKKLKLLLKNSKSYSIKNQAQDIYFSLALYLETNNLKIVKERITEANKKIIILDSNNVSTGFYFRYLSVYYSKINKQKQALKYIDTMSMYFRKTKLPIYKELISKTYANLYKDIKDIKNFTTYKDSLSILEKNELEKIQKAYIDVIEETLNYTKIINQVKFQKNIQVCIFVFSFIFFIVVLCFLKKSYISNNRLKIYQNQLKDVHENEDINALNGISKGLNIFLSNTDDLIHINNMQDKFCYKLKPVFPSLTDIEIQVCFLMKLNIKTVDIGLTLNRTTRSIENIKFRIRKKIKKKTDTSLENIIDGINL